MIKYICSMVCKWMGCAGYLRSAALLAARLWIAKVFLYSGLTKIKSWDTTIMLFADEYQVPLLPPEIAAYLATGAEFILPVLLILGLVTPLAALGIFCMTLVIELLVYPGITEHYYWLLLSAILFTHGGGKFAIDNLLMKYFHKKSSGSCPKN